MTQHPLDIPRPSNQPPVGPVVARKCTTGVQVSDGDTARVLFWMNLSGAYGGNKNLEQAFKDAMVMAAGFDLLAALKSVTELLEGFREHPIDQDLDEDEVPIIAPALDQARAAIAKAEGK